MKKIIKYMIFILAIFLINISSIDAEEYNGVIEAGEAIDGIYYYKTRSDSESITYPTHSFHEQAHIYYDSVNHHVVYCIESWHPITGAMPNDYSVYDKNVEKTNLTDSEMEEINLLAYYGYGYKDSEYDHTSAEWYAITQMLIWQIQAPNYNHYIVNSITSTKPIISYNSKMDEIRLLVRKHKNDLSLYDKKMKINTAVENKDISNNLKYYKVDKCDDGIEAVIEEDKVIIKSLNKLGDFSYSLRRKYNKWNKKMKIYISDRYQNVFEPGDMDDSIITKKVTVDGYKLDFAVYALVPYKLTEEGNKSYITHFFPDIEIAIIAKNDIYDGAGNIVYKKGSIYSKVKSTNNYSSVEMPSGTFELQILTNIPGFKGSPKVVEIKKSKVTAGISLKRSLFVINLYKTLEKLGENGKIAKEAGENITFGIYASEDIKNLSGQLLIKKDYLIDTFATNELGKISKIEEFLLPGEYYLKELTELDNYEINNQKYEVNLKYEENYKDYLETDEIIVENKLKTGTLNIKKLDADEYYPLENVVYSIYSKDNTLIATKSTDSYGEASFDLKVGEYYMKENNALDGYIRDEKTYYVKIDHTNLDPYYKLLNEKIIKDEVPEVEDKPDEPITEPDDPITEPDDPKTEPDEPIINPEDPRDEPILPSDNPENTDKPNVPNEDNKEINKSEESKIEELDQTLNKEEGLIVDVPSTDVHDCSFVLLFLLSITLISIRKCLKE